MLATQNHRIGIAASSRYQDYFPDYRLWQLRQGLSGLNDQGDTQVSVFMVLVIRTYQSIRTNQSQSDLPIGPSWEPWQIRVISTVFWLLRLLLLLVVIHVLRGPH